MKPNKPVANKIYPARLFAGAAVACPRCGQAVTGHVGARRTGPGVTTASVVYTLYPCQCEADDYWVDAFSVEMRRRTKGKPSRDVGRRAVGNRTALADKLHARLAVLYGRREAAVVAGQPNRKAALEREICLSLTAVARVGDGGPAAAVASVQPIAMEREVVRWARKAKMVTPPGDGGPPPRGPLGVEQIHQHLKGDEEFNAGLNPRRVRMLAVAMHRELQDFATKAKPVSRATFRLLVKLVPGADAFIIARDVDVPEVHDPQEQFQNEFARRRRRRVDLRHDDTDE
jgi:hypothetical protein